MSLSFCLTGFTVSSSFDLSSFAEYFMASAWASSVSSLLSISSFFILKVAGKSPGLYCGGFSGSDLCQRLSELHFSDWILNRIWIFRYAASCNRLTISLTASSDKSNHSPLFLCSAYLLCNWLSISIGAEQIVFINGI